MGGEGNTKKNKKNINEEEGKEDREVGSNHKPHEGKIKLRRLEIHTIPGTAKLHEGQIDWPAIREHRGKRSAS